MSDILEKIIKEKIIEVMRLKQTQQSEDFVQGHHSLKAALQKPGLSIIAEIKRRSPSKGTLSDIIDPVALALSYEQAGASAISVLTDKQFFSGSIDDLKKVSTAVKSRNIPVLRKDFLIDRAQLLEAKQAGADAVLLIVAVLQDQTAAFIKMARDLQLDALVEVHHKKELDIALKAHAEIIGINNRNLSTFAVDINVSLDLVTFIPDHIVKVSESGLKNITDIKRIKQAGFDAVLVGEALVTSNDPKKLITAMRGLS